MQLPNLVIVGPTCAGKTTLAKHLQDKYGYERIITVTDRPMRDNEIEGIDYQFILPEEFEQKKMYGEFVEYKEYNAVFGTCHYGSYFEDYFFYTMGLIPWVAVLTPDAIPALKPYFEFKVIFLDADNSLIYARALRRGDDWDEISRRIQTDRDLFNAFYYSKQWDYFMTNLLINEDKSDE